MPNVYKHSRWVQSSILLALFFVVLEFNHWLQERMDVITVHVAGLPLQVEVASNPTSRARGLEFRSTLAANEGMLFVFPEPIKGGFWMKDTYINLDIGFFDDQGRLIETCPMTAMDYVSRCVPSKPTKYALEVRRGWFTANQITANAPLQLPRSIEAR